VAVPRVALIAHDERKPTLLALARERQATLAEWDLVATGTTGRRLNEGTDLTVERVASGPEGGDLMIGAAVAEGTVDAVIFLRDPQTPHPHDPDIGALLRICDVTDTAIATNVASARYVIDGLSSPSGFDPDEP
jgi:methylglyoxal synthase